MLPIVSTPPNLLFISDDEIDESEQNSTNVSCYESSESAEGSELNYVRCNTTFGLKLDLFGI